jgi:hypothetical protein
MATACTTPTVPGAGSTRKGKGPWWSKKGQTACASQSTYNLYCNVICWVSKGVALLRSTSNLLDPQNPQSRFDMNQIIPSLSHPLPQDINQLDMIFSQRQKQTNFNQTLTTGWWSSHQKNLLVKLESYSNRAWTKMSRCQPVPSFLCAFWSYRKGSSSPGIGCASEYQSSNASKITSDSADPRAAPPPGYGKWGSPPPLIKQMEKRARIFMELRLSGMQLVAFWGTVVGITRREGWSP